MKRRSCLISTVSITSTLVGCRAFEMASVPSKRFKTYLIAITEDEDRDAAAPALDEIEQRVEPDDFFAKDEIQEYGGAALKSLEEEGWAEYEESRIAKWRPAESLLTLRSIINRLAPSRSREDDGFIGDNDHQNRKSDHNPWVLDGDTGVVTAFDVTHSLGSGAGSRCDAERLKDSLIKSRDERIKYIIWNKQIYSSYSVGGSAPFAKRPYKGKNAHTHHLHISVFPEKSSYDSTKVWEGIIV